MKPIHLALGSVAIALALTGTAGAATTPSTYAFTSPTGSTGTINNTAAGWNASNGTNWGNSLTFTSTGTVVPVTVTAWASTGGSGGFGGTIQSAAVTQYSTNNGANNEIAITSRSATDSSGNTTNSITSGSTQVADNANMNAELIGWTPNANDLQHAMDNAGAYEALLFSFTSAVTLKDVSIGFPSANSGIDSDMTFLVYTGKNCTPSPCGAAPTSGFSTRTFADLIANGGWELAGNGVDLATASSGKATLNTTASSQYWMAGAYMAIGTNTATSPGNTKPADYVKVSGLTAIRAVPEPSSVALFGIAAAGLLAARRRKRADA